MTESTVGWFGMREKYCSLADKLNTTKRTGREVGPLVLLSQYLRGYQYLIVKSHFTAV